ncbi:hypothetical protein [Peribacillus sp. SCS-155]|uniref:hypothetical protein n=1 Tax=Peribacillus sedimenti TaxID=3115297 RepID=UPI00390624FD
MVNEQKFPFLRRELDRLLNDYERCGEDVSKAEIMEDIKLIMSVLPDSGSPHSQEIYLLRKLESQK